MYEIVWVMSHDDTPNALCCAALHQSCVDVSCVISHTTLYFTTSSVVLCSYALRTIVVRLTAVAADDAIHAFNFLNCLFCFELIIFYDQKFIEFLF